MSGVISGVQARIKEVQPKARYIHCFAHSLNLVIEKVCDQCPFIRDPLSYINEVAKFFGESAKRKSTQAHEVGHQPRDWSANFVHGVEGAVQFILEEPLRLASREIRPSSVYPFEVHYQGQDGPD